MIYFSSIVVVFIHIRRLNLKLCFRWEPDSFELEVWIEKVWDQVRIHSDWELKLSRIKSMFLIEFEFNRIEKDWNFVLNWSKSQSG